MMAMPQSISYKHRQLRYADYLQLIASLLFESLSNKHRHLFSSDINTIQTKRTPFAAAQHFFTHHLITQFQQFFSRITNKETEYFFYIKIKDFSCTLSAYFFKH